MGTQVKLLNLLKEMEATLPPPPHCHHAITYARYGSEEQGWEDKLALQLNMGGKFLAFFLEPEDLEKGVSDLIADIVSEAGKLDEHTQYGVGPGRYSNPELKPERYRMDWTEKNRERLFETLSKPGLCNCGHGVTWDIVKNLLERAAANGSGDNGGDPAFYGKAEDADARWVEFGGHVMNSFGWVEYGSGVGSAWLTENGRTVLEFLRDFGTDDHNWPGWAFSPDWQE